MSANANSARTGLARNFRVDRSKISAEQRTVELAFSSEAPVERWGENEVLSHQKGDYDFGRLNDAHPLLLGHAEHDPMAQIGVIESARVDADGIGRAVVRFSKSTLGQEIFQDVQDGIRELVSVGYDRTGIISSEKSKDGMMTTRYRWTPTHIAIVPVPADTSVGVGRDKPQVDSPQTSNAPEAQTKLTKQNEMRTLLDPQVTGSGGGAATAEDINTARATALSDERNRAKEIGTVADLLIKDHGRRNGGAMSEQIRSMAQKAITEGSTVQDFQIACMRDVLSAKPATPVSLSECTDDPSAYSVLRGIQSAMKNRENGRAAIPDGREGEVHQEVMRRAADRGGLGYDAAGFQVPFDAPVRSGRGIRLGRDMQATVFNTGGAFVPTQLTLPVIELLRNMAVLPKLGIRTMAGLQGNIVIPRQEAAATAYAVGEISSLTASQQILGQIAMTPHRVGAQQVYSKQFILQSSPDAEAFLRDDLLRVIALKLDYLGLNGQGAADEPLGVFNTPGIGSILFGATPTYKKLVTMRTAIRSANVTDPLAYISTPAVEGLLMTVAEALTGATTVGGASNAIWKPGAEVGEGRVVGHPAYASNQVPGDRVACGAWTHLIHAQWGGLDVVVDQFTKAANAEWVITFNTWNDFTLRHPQAFVVSADSGNQ